MATRPTHPLPLAAFEVATFPPRAPRWPFVVRVAAQIVVSALRWMVLAAVGFLLFCGAREVLHVVAGR